MLNDHYDIVIVGARIAGATLAAFMGDAGYSILLIDRGHFPSTTLSTHYFRGKFALSVFQSLGILDDILALGAPPLTCRYVYIDGRAEADVQPPQDPGQVGYCLSVRREPLDAVLLQRAQQTGSVQFLQETRLLDLIREDERVVGVKIQHEGDVHITRTRIVVGADGRNSSVARAAGAPYMDQMPGTRAMYYRYFRDYAAVNGAVHDGAEFSFRGDELAYVFPSDNALTCVALSISLEAFKAIRHDAKNGYMARLAHHQGIADRILAASPEDKLWVQGPQRNYIRVPFGPGWALVGDAGIHQDPWTGHGIDMASTHAAMLADALKTALADPGNETAAMQQYQQQRDKAAVRIYHNTVNLGRDLRQVFAG